MSELLHNNEELTPDNELTRQDEMTPKEEMPTQTQNAEVTESEAAETPPARQEDTPAPAQDDTTPAEESAPIQEASAPAQEYAAPIEEQAEPQPRAKGKKPLKVLLAAVLSIVLFLAITTGTAYALFPEQVRRMVMGDEKYFVYLESKSLTKGSDGLVELFSLLTNNQIAEKTTQSLKFTPFIDAAALGIPGSEYMVSKINKCHFDIDTIINEDGSSANIVTLFYDNNSVVTAELYNKDGKNFAKIPGLSDKYLVFPLEISPDVATNPTKIREISSLNPNELLAIEFDEAKLKKSAKELVDIFVNNLKGVETSTETLVKAGITKKLNVMTVELDGEEFAILYKELVKQAKKDNYIKEIVAKNAENLFGMELKAEEIDTFFDSVINMIDTDIQNGQFDNLMFKYQCFTDGKDNIAGKRLTLKDGTEEIIVEYFDFADKSDKALVFSIVTATNNEVRAGSDFTIEIKYTETSGKYTGTAKIMSGYLPIINARFSDIEIAGKDFSGTVEIEMFKLMGNPYILKFEAAKDSLEISFMGNVKILSITAALQQKELGNIEIPELTADNFENIASNEEFEAWLDTVDLEGFATEALRKFDLSDTEIKLILASIFSGLNNEFDPGDYNLDEYDDFDFDFDDFDFEDIEL